MKGDYLDKLTQLLNEMGVSRCIIHFKDKSARLLVDAEVGQRSISAFRKAMGQEVVDDELVELFEPKKDGAKRTWAVSAAEHTKDKDALVVRLTDWGYRRLNERGVELYVEQWEFKPEPKRKWYEIWK